MCKEEKLMKKKLVAVLMTAAMAVSLAACANAGGTSTSTTSTTDTGKTETSSSTSAGTESGQAAGDTTVKIWVADAVVDFTKNQIENFKSANPEYAGYDFVVEAVGEGDAAGNMITDVTAGADIFGFAQDQLARLVAAGALIDVSPDNIAALSSQNDAGSVAAAKVGDVFYAYPMTSDNGYFLYYDKSVISDPSTLEGVVADCEAAGKSIYMDLTGWYQTSFFFGTGCQMTYDTDDSGNFIKANVDYDSEQGLVALKEMIELASSSAFQPGSSAGDAINYAAIVDGTWDAATVKAFLGDNYACAKLPTFTGSDGKTYQMSGFGGFKLLGVKPQTDEAKLACCDALALYLTSEEVQLARFNEVGWGPSNLNAQKSDAVKADEALAALGQQLAFTIPQGQYPGDYWSRAEALAGDVQDSFKTASDDDLKAALATFQADLESYAK